MKKGPFVPPPIVQPMIDELTARCKPGLTKPQTSPQPAELDQDPGGGYNPDHTYPQV